MLNKTRFQIVFLAMLVVIYGVQFANAQQSRNSPTPTPTPLAVPTNLPVPTPQGFKRINCIPPRPGCPIDFTRAEFGIAVNNPSEQIKKGVLENIKRIETFVSLRDANRRQQARRPTEKMQRLLDEEYFSSLLSSDATIVIGKEIYRINPDKNLAFVATFTDNTEENTKLYDELLKENIRNPKIKSYSLEEDVLELVNDRRERPTTGAAEPATASLFCSESGIGGKQSSTNWININSTSNMKGDVIFNKFGIYFSLFASLQATMNIYKLGIEVEPVQYKPRCKSQVGPYNSFPTVQSTYNKFQSYQGSTNLNKVQLRARFYAYLASNNALVKTSDWIEIKANY